MSVDRAKADFRWLRPTSANGGPAAPPGGGRDISSKAFRHTLHLLTSVGKIDRGATSSGKSVGAPPRRSALRCSSLPALAAARKQDDNLRRWWQTWFQDLARQEKTKKSDRQGHVVKGRRGLMKRLFLGIAVTALMASAFVGSTTAVMAQTKTLKMQATWPASLTLYENFTYFAERVEQAIGRHAEDRRDARRPGRAGLRGARRHPQEGARRRACVGRLLDRQEQDRDPVHRRSRRHLRHGLHRRAWAGCTTAAASSFTTSSTRRSSSSTSSCSRSCLRVRRRSAGSRSRSRPSRT